MLAFKTARLQHFVSHFCRPGVKHQKSKSRANCDTRHVTSSWKKCGTAQLSPWVALQLMGGQVPNIDISIMEARAFSPNKKRKNKNTTQEQAQRTFTLEVPSRLHSMGHPICLMRDKPVGSGLKALLLWTPLQQVSVVVGLVENPFIPQKVKVQRSNPAVKKAPAFGALFP